METVPVIVTAIPDKIARALVRDSRKQNASLNEVATRILCQLYDHPWEPSGRTRAASAVNTDRLYLRVPPPVRHQLRVDAANEGATISGLVKVALATAYGLRPPSPNRGAA